MRNILTTTPPKYIDPMIDFAFKKIFKESGNKQLLIRPLNAIFGIDIADLDIKESEHLGGTPEERNASFDLFCTATDGKKFIVEVQLSQQRHFLERALFYTTFPIAEAARKGRSWDYDYPPVFFLGLMNFDFRELRGQEGTDRGRFVHRFCLRNDETGGVMTDRLQFVFMEIGRFDKAASECGSFEEKFLYMMKNIPTFAEAPELLWDDPYFASLLDEAEYAGMSGEQKAQYREAMRRDWDYKNTIDFAHDKGFEEGREQGRAEGEAKGRAEGRTEEQRAIAKRFLSAGLSAEAVAEGTGLTLEQVKALSED